MKTLALTSRIPWFTAMRKLATEKTKPSPERPPRIGLCLSSGGSRGLAHVGVIQVLEEEGIPIAAISGSSMGSYVGALWAAGCNGVRLEELAREIKDRKTLLSLLDPLFPPSQGLIRGHKIRRHLERSLGTMTFKDLRIPLLVVATELDRLIPTVFTEGNVAAAVHASSAIPGICAPVDLDGHRYTDGGASEPLPVTLLRQRFNVDRIIAVNVMPAPEDIEKCRATDFVTARRVTRNPLLKLCRTINLMAYGNVLDTFRRSLMAAQIQVAEKEAVHADVVLHPFFCEATWYDFEHFDRYIKAGRAAALAALPQIRALLNPVPTKPSKGGYYETAPSCTALGSLIA